MKIKIVFFLMQACVFFRREPCTSKINCLYFTESQVYFFYFCADTTIVYFPTINLLIDFLGSYEQMVLFSTHPYTARAMRTSVIKTFDR